jgi:hypothetical protein
MEAKTETKVVSVTLTMTQEEAEWLKDVMQNPFCEDCGRESEEEQHMRERFWSTLATVWPQQKGQPVSIKQAEKQSCRCPNCGESDPRKLNIVTLSKSDRLSTFVHIDLPQYEHYLECQSCSVKGPKFVTDSSIPPPAMHKLWEAV